MTADLGVLARQLVGDEAGVVAAAVVDEQDLETVQALGRGFDVRDHALQAAGLVVRGHDDRQRARARCNAASRLMRQHPEGCAIGIFDRPRMARDGLADCRGANERPAAADATLTPRMAPPTQAVSQTAAFVGMSHLGIVSSAGWASHGRPVRARRSRSRADCQTRGRRAASPRAGPARAASPARGGVLHFSSDFDDLAECDLVVVARDVPTDADNVSDIARGQRPGRARRAASTAGRDAGDHEPGAARLHASPRPAHPGPASVAHVQPLLLGRDAHLRRRGAAGAGARAVHDRLRRSARSRSRPRSTRGCAPSAARSCPCATRAPSWRRRPSTCT